LTNDATEIQFVDWWKLAPYLSVDFARLLGKGSNYRVRVRRTKGLDFKPTKHDLEMFRYMYRVTGEDVSTKSLQRESWVQTQLLSSIVKQLSKRWVIRKEDHSTRFILCEKTWETTQFKEVCAELNLELVGEGVNDKYVYLNPKIKPNKVPGRPIVSFSKVKRSMRASCKELTGSIREWSRGKGLGTVSTFDAIERIKPKLEDAQFLGGDVKQLFTSVRQKYLLEWIETEIPSALALVKEVMSSEISFNGKIYRNTEGLCMGSPYSPILAEFYLTMIETMVPGLKGSRYCDNFVIVGDDLGQLTKMRKLYEEQLERHNLRVTWEGNNARCPFLDCSFRKVGQVWGRRFEGKPSNIIKEQLPLSVFRNTVIGEIKRRTSRFYSSGRGRGAQTKYRANIEYHQVLNEFRDRLDISDDLLWTLRERSLQPPRKKSEVERELCTTLSLTWFSFYDSRQGKRALARCIADIRTRYPYLRVRWRYPGVQLRCLLTSRTLQRGSTLKSTDESLSGRGRNG